MHKYTGNKPDLEYTFYKGNTERTQSYQEKVLSSSKKGRLILTPERVKLISSKRNN